MAKIDYHSKKEPQSSGSEMVYYLREVDDVDHNLESKLL